MDTVHCRGLPLRVGVTSDRAAMLSHPAEMFLVRKGLFFFFLMAVDRIDWPYERSEGDSSPGRCRSSTLGFVPLSTCQG